ncbi:MAG: hypothetical protein AAF517_11425 [Planctomycetota bacterium]
MSIDLEQLSKGLKYHEDAGVDAVRADMDVLRRLDDVAESEEAKWRNLGCGSIILLILAMVGMAASGMLDSSPVVAVPTIIVFVGATIFCFVQKSRKGRLNLTNRRYELVDGLLHLLKVDMSKDAVVHVAIDFNRSDSKEKFVRNGQANTWKVKFYEDPWLELKGRLLDGTSFQLGITDRTQHRSKTKRSASGKLKTKSKSKRSSVAVLRLKIKPRKYPGLEAYAEDAEGALQLPTSAMGKDMFVDENGLVLKVLLNDSWKANARKHHEEAVVGDGIDITARMFLSCYQVLNLAKTVAKRGGAEGGA